MGKIILDLPLSLNALTVTLKEFSPKYENALLYIVINTLWNGMVNRYNDSLEKGKGILLIQIELEIENMLFPSEYGSGLSQREKDDLHYIMTNISHMFKTIIESLEDIIHIYNLTPSRHGLLAALSNKLIFGKD